MGTCGGRWGDMWVPEGAGGVICGYLSCGSRWG